VLTAAPVVNAAPSKTIAEVEAEIANLQNEAEIASENLNGARVKLAAIQDKQAQTKSKIKSAKSALAGEAKNLGQMASEAYRSGAIDASVQLLMADNPADFLQQSAALEIVAKGQNTVLRRTTAARIQLDQANAALGQQEAEAAAVEQDIANQKAAIDSSLAEQQKVLSQLKEEERRRIEAERKAKAEASARAAAAAQAAANQAARDAQARAAAAANNNDTTTADTGGPGGSNSSSGSSGSSGGGSSSSGGSSSGGGQNGGFVGADQAAIAVAAALAQVGEPYTYDAHPPDTWDCSKLTAWAWGQAGVSLTAYSYDQANEVRHISTSELRPGDLLFYFNDAHHVAMYIGGGQIVEAASPSRGVQVTDAWNNWSSAHFSFAGRPVG
jgi:hypothetical protein